MYGTCLYCHRDLGNNESVENFPIGRRLAFDQAMGRLWIVCTRCRRWNLTPLEERWEAIEECERHFCDTPTRYSTENIGLARLDEGVELVRIGKPERREFAFWRYAKRLTQRRQTYAALDAVVGMVVALPLVVTSVPGSNLLYVPIMYALSRRPVARITLPDGTMASVRQSDLSLVQLHRSGHEEGFALTLKYYSESGPWWRVMLASRAQRGTVRLYGAEAVRTAGLILPRLNAKGASSRQVRQAIDMIDEAGGPKRFFATTPDRTPRRTWVVYMPRPLRLALEMAAHEESERRALEGELAELEAAWREAEEIAAIADRLLIPPTIEEWIKKHRRR